MPENEMNEILQRLTRVETKLDIMNSARDIAQEALQSSKSAHHRLDELREEIAKQLIEIRADIGRVKDKQSESQRWLIGTMISAAALFIAAVGLMIKFGA